MEDTLSGMIKWFKTHKGYGFIVPDDGGPEVFLHKTTLRRCCGVETLPELEKVRYLVLPAKDGRTQASYVRRLGGEEETRLRLENEALRAALENMVGAFDNPVVLRKLKGDEFALEAIASGRAALAGQHLDTGGQP